MNTLGKILSSRVRSEIFRILFGQKGVELHNREIEQRSGLSESNVRRELRNLENLDLVRRRKDSNRVYYRANEDHPLYREIHNMVLKTSGLAGLLKAALDDERILLAFVFGSIAAGEEQAGSDVDLMVVGDIGLRDLSGLLSGISDKIGREINPHVFPEAELRERIAAGDRFIAGVLDSKKTLIIGSDDELKAMGG